MMTIYSPIATAVLKLAKEKEEYRVLYHFSQVGSLAAQTHALTQKAASVIKFKNTYKK